MTNFRIKYTFAQETDLEIKIAKTTQTKNKKKKN